MADGLGLDPWWDEPLVRCHEDLVEQRPVGPGRSSSIRN
jgi:hypothetical protein